MALPAGMSGLTIVELHALYEKLLVDVPRTAFQRGGAAGQDVDVRVDDLTKFSSKDLELIEKEVGPLPEDLSAFWSMGVRYVYVRCSGETLSSTFQTPSSVLRNIEIAKEIAQNETPRNDDEREFKRLLERGAPFFGGETYYLVDTDQKEATGVRRVAFDSPPVGKQLTPVAPTFTHWFEAYLALGLDPEHDSSIDLGFALPFKLPKEKNKLSRFLKLWLADA